MQLFGYIEGYYGKLLNWHEREILVNALAESGFNAYIYAPKEDRYHRLEWYKAYPPLWFKYFTNWVATAKRRKIRVIPGISPGLSYDYTDKNCFNRLKTKLLKFFSSDVDTVLLSMDDIPTNLPYPSQGSFKSLGHAHGHLLTRLSRIIRQRVPSANLLFCPTVYCSAFGVNREGKVYLKDLSETMPADVQIFWTGPDVISKYIHVQHLRPIQNLFDDKWMIWDNYYANDYCPNRLFSGPLKGRSRILAKHGSGYFINPTGLPYTDSILIKLTAAWLEGNTNKTKWWKELKRAGVPDAYKKVAQFFDSPFYNFSRKDQLTSGATAMLEALEYLLFDWKSGLQREWYVSLYNLRTDLQFISTDEPGLKMRVFRKYSPFMQKTLSDVLKLRPPDLPSSDYGL